MKNPDPAGTLARLMLAGMNKKYGVLNVALPCRVLSYDASSCLATVQPLVRSGPDKPAPIESVPALGQRYSVDGGAEQIFKPSLHVGDVVLVVCADREIKNTLAGQIASPDTARQHNLNDAVIVGVFGCNL
ncbi:hypothetical protein PAECIP111893_00259 [Paenibacillus plantiphilus]|uniref:Phage protein Gp138 N-terminal domain-containing protein n=1 Tax=Paenibacillus plantiphilus TaxID=2905650 RepID=A0ABN8FQF7_9BACL|nr:Gp138 family membrane-puncturing spike protein [Paenibacillus plantiphilus]CAH1190290.1 hypothetical protein PAECIP111893_00259 [Paenibacillus plantiphilus]